MMTKSIGITCVAIASLFANSIGKARADEPQGVVRTFAVLVTEPVDFTDDDSVLVKAGNSDVSLSIKEYIDGSGSDFDGTFWAFASSGMYITKGEGVTPIGGFAWLLSAENPDPPPAEAVALLGPDAAVIQESLGHVYVDGPYIFPSPDPAKPVMIVVTAVFSK